MTHKNSCLLSGMSSLYSSSFSRKTSSAFRTNPKAKTSRTSRTGDRPGQDQMHQATVYPPRGVKMTKQPGSLFWPKELFHSRPLRPIFCSPFVFPLMRNICPVSCMCAVFVSSWCPVVVRSSQCSLRQSMVFVSTGMVCFSIPRAGIWLYDSVPWLLSFIDWLVH